MSAINPSGSASQEERESLLSAMYDGEVSSAEGELVARRLGRDPALRLKWSRYALSAAVLRGDQGYLLSSKFSQRVATAIASEPTHGSTHGSTAGTDLGPRSATGGLPGGRLRVRAERSGQYGAGGAVGGARWWRPAAGAVLAAGVAAASIVIMRGAPEWMTRSAQPLAAAVNGEVSVVSREPASYTVPPSLARARASGMPAAQLANYVVAHSEFSNPLGRRNLLSSLMAGESLGGSASWPASGPGLEPSSMGPDGSALDEPSGVGDAR
jgi:hypothetical protein